MSHLVRTQSLNVLPLKPGVGQYIAIHATLTSRDFSSLLISTLPVHSPAFIPKPFPIFPVLAVANTWFLCRPAEWNRSPCRMQVPVLSARGILIDYIKKIIKLKHDLWYDDLWNEQLGDRVKFVFGLDVILCGWLGSMHRLTNILKKGCPHWHIYPPF